MNSSPDLPILNMFFLQYFDAFSPHQVHIKVFKPKDNQNPYTMSGPHRLCVTPDDVKFFPMGKSTPIPFPIIGLRSCLQEDRLFQLETGHSTYSGAGFLLVFCEDKDIAVNLNGAVLAAMDSKRLNRDNWSMSKSTSKSRESRNDSKAGGTSTSYRPRSESW